MYNGTKDASSVVPEEDPGNNNEEFLFVLPNQMVVMESKYFVRSLYNFNEYLWVKQ